jgi:hypothetical protein
MNVKYNVFRPFLGDDFLFLLFPVNTQNLSKQIPHLIQERRLAANKKKHAK